MPQNDIEVVLDDYRKKIHKKKLDSSKIIPKPPRL